MSSLVYTFKLYLFFSCDFDIQWPKHSSYLAENTERNFGKKQWQTRDFHLRGVDSIGSLVFGEHGGFSYGF